MDITINNQYDNKLLQRNEVTATMLFEGATPDRKQVQQAIAAQTKAKEKLVIITNINTSFGNSKAEISAHIYKDEAIMFRNERKNLIEKHKGHDPEEIKAAEEAAKKAAEAHSNEVTGAQKQEVSSEKAAQEEAADKPNTDDQNAESEQADDKEAQ